MKSPAQARRLEEKVQRRMDILDATEKVIEKKGWAETNFGDIAQITRLSRSLIYVYFPSREHLFHAICDRGFVVLNQVFEEAITDQQSGLEQVEAIGRAYHRFSMEYPMYFKMHAEQQSQDDQTSTQEGGPPPAAHPAFGPISQALIKGMRDGSVNISMEDLKKTALALWTFTHGLLLITARKRTFLREHMEVEPDQLVDHGFGLLRDMLRTGGGSLKA